VKKYFSTRCLKFRKIVNLITYDKTFANYKDISKITFEELNNTNTNINVKICKIYIKEMVALKPEKEYVESVLKTAKSLDPVEVKVAGDGK